MADGGLLKIRKSRKLSMREKPLTSSRWLAWLF
jgi:hypothetical protein